MDTLERIMNLKSQLKISDLALERKLKLTPRIIAGWKCGKSDTYLKIIPQIAKALNTTSAYLLCETDNPTPPGKKETPSDISTEEALLIAIRGMLGREPTEDELRRYLEMGKLLFNVED